MAEHTPSLDAPPGYDALCHVCGAVQKWVDHKLPKMSHWEECPMHKAAPGLLAALEEARAALHNTGAELYREESERDDWNNIFANWPTVRRIDAAIAKTRNTAGG